MATVYMLTTADDQIAGYSEADFRRLSAAAASDRFRIHTLVDSPDAADIILFVGSTYPDHWDVRQHPLLQTHRDRCFLFHSEDYVIPFLPGVYVNVSRRWHTRRTLTGPYLQMLHWDHVPHVPSLDQCEYLFCFVGSARTHRVRPRVMALSHPRGYLENTSAGIASQHQNHAFFMVPYRQDEKARYGGIISRSKFVLCPRGYACSTWRLYETLKAGRVPVIISDQWVPPQGPAWDTCSIRVPERRVAEIPALLERLEPQAETMARAARLAWEDWFSNQTIFHRMVEWCLLLQRDAPVVSVRQLTPWLQLLRPFYARHVLLPRARQAITTRAGSILRRFSKT
jgi:hypothetical protein